VIAHTHVQIDMRVIVGRRRTDAGEMPRANPYLTDTQIVFELRVATWHCVVSRQLLPLVDVLASFDAVQRVLSTSTQDIEIADGAFQIGASVIAAGLGIQVDQVLFLVRSGEIESASEHGVDEDAGFHRLTFYYHNRRFRLIIDGTGRIVRRSRVDFGERGRPPRKGP
jgi:Family of unknown function (DUF6522)